MTDQTSPLSPKGFRILSKFGNSEKCLLPAVKSPIPQETTSSSKKTSYCSTYKFKKKENENPYRGYFKMCLCGLSLMGLAYTINFIDPIELVKNMMLNMHDGSYLFRMWKSPPIKLFIKVYLFNITNPERFITGEDENLKVKEIGPYTYSEVVRNKNITFNSNNTISFTPLRNVSFEPELSVGDPMTDKFTVANIPFLGIASMIHNSSIAMNLALSTIASYLNASPLLTLPVDSFLWGYDDPLVKLARRVFPSWIDFERFGLLDRMMDEGSNRVTMMVNSSSEQYAIDNFNGYPGLQEWGYRPEHNRTLNCNRVKGTVEGLLFPRNLNPNQTFAMYRKAFCRPLPLVFNRQLKTTEGLDGFVYKFSDDFLDPRNPNNSCYCRPKGNCLPNGLSDISPCYYNIPVAISLPHFIKGNQSLSNRIEGLSPDIAKHDTEFVVNKDVGVPLFVKTRIQLNLVVKNTKFIPRVKRFNNLVIPVLWLEVELRGLPKSVTRLLELLLIIGPAAQTAAIVVTAAAGLSLVFLANLRYAWRSGLLDTSGRRAAIISFRRKQQSSRPYWRSCDNNNGSNGSGGGGSYAQLPASVHGVAMALLPSACQTSSQLARSR